ncbi:serine/threonine-protein phosphatase [Solirubrobacter sp. CPCC 204708]|uniref:Serine/threonine-protein phosphatase n=1 Tax=Solirubrobacter deserti TaxID=2282478 RepID=A0ABT4RG44_9ACTN|nr:PP2C family protein-serine/threonine phosphatase [Solirubrobacter deserti]MBE2319441.1 serine/threonine-protein phosphatase [Solirubrobacter deserti]MDA0137275.1 serine/threonine-protein phosphatase [Solirubrobacter deserti]
MAADAESTNLDPRPAGTNAELLLELLRRTHLSAPSDLAEVIAETAALIGATDVVVYVIDFEQATLVPLGARYGGEVLSVAGTIAGRAFSTTSILRTPTEAPHGERLWLPLLDGTERLGVLAMTLVTGTLSEATVTLLERYAHLVATLMATKGNYGDAIETARRRQPMTIASEMVWSLAPPLVFATNDLSLAAVLEPAYDNGGDAFDYAVDERVLHLGIFDAMGHGLPAAGVAAFALAAYRNRRRAGSNLMETSAAMDAAVGEQFPDSRFVTALIARLELDSGQLTWICAGHPPPLVIRDGRHVRELESIPEPPLGTGLGAAAPTMMSESLEPGDLLLFYTDGLVEAHDRNGMRFTLEDVGRYIAREATAGQTVPETLRRFRHAMLGRERADLRDDATAVLVRWRGGDERRLLPQTVL